jgi:phosphoglycerol geranylgeranyltransferase
MSHVLELLREARRTGQKLLMVLFDPDDAPEQVEKLAYICENESVDIVLIGGSLLTHGHTAACLKRVKSAYSGPCVLFPGSEIQLVPGADALLLLSLISGRNAEYLIGKHVVAAPFIKEHRLDCIPTGYILVENGKLTTANYISQTLPIPADKPEIAAVTALAGTQLGLQLIYLDGGSGAVHPVSETMVRAVSQMVDTPIIVGGGIRSMAEARLAWESGATAVVIGNVLANHPGLIGLLSEIKREIQA